jgi:hypothetical protein
MLWSFVGLVMATNSHFFRYAVPLVHEVGLFSIGASFGLTGFVLWGVPAIVGTIWIERLKAQYSGVSPETVAGS